MSGKRGDGAATSDQLLESLFDEIKTTGDLAVILAEAEVAAEDESRKKKHKSRDRHRNVSGDHKTERKKKKEKKIAKKDKRKREEKKSKSKKDPDKEKKKKKKKDRHHKEHTSEQESKTKRSPTPSFQRSRRRSQTPLSPKSFLRASKIADSKRLIVRSRDRSRSRSSSRNGPRSSHRHDAGFQWGSPTRRRERPWDRKERWSRSDSRSPSRHRRRQSDSPRHHEGDLSKLSKDEVMKIAKANASKLYMQGKLPEKMMMGKNFKDLSLHAMIKFVEDINKVEYKPDNKSVLPEESGRDFDFSTAPVRNRSIKVNIKLGKEATLRQTFPVSRGSTDVDPGEWEPILPVSSVVDELAKKRVKVTPAYIPQFPPISYPLPPPKKPKKEAEKKKPLPPETPPVSAVMDWEFILDPPPAPPTFATFEAPVVDVPEPPKVISNFSELLTHEEMEELCKMGTSAQDEFCDMDVDDDESASVSEPSASTDGDDPVAEVVNRIITRVVKMVEGNAGKTRFEPASEAEDTAGTSTTSLSRESVNNRIAADGQSVFGSFTQLSLSSQTQSVLPVMAPIACSHLVAERARLARIVSKNPQDTAARMEMADVELKLSRWAQAKSQNSAHFGAAPVMDAQRETRIPSNTIWATKDTLRNAPEFMGGIGAHLLQKMGWVPGYGLGRNLDGAVDPLILDVKSDRKGLFSAVEKAPAKRQKTADVNGKNPVSVIMEYCSKKGYPPPLFMPLEDCASNIKRYRCKAVLNNVEYDAASASSNKKAAKAEVCLIMCKALNIV